MFLVELHLSMFFCLFFSRVFSYIMKKAEELVVMEYVRAILSRYALCFVSKNSGINIETYKIMVEMSADEIVASVDLLR